MNRTDIIHATIDGPVDAISFKAFGFKLDTPDAFWIPKSQVHSVCKQDGGDCGVKEVNKQDYIESVEIPRWLAEDKGLTEKVD